MRAVTSLKNILERTLTLTLTSCKNYSKSSSAFSSGISKFSSVKNHRSQITGFGFCHCDCGIKTDVRLSLCGKMSTGKGSTETSPREDKSPRQGQENSPRQGQEKSPRQGQEKSPPGAGASPGGAKPRGCVDLSAVPTWTEYSTVHKLPTPSSSPRSEDDADNFKVDTEINDKVSIWRGDITKLEIGAIVNAANSRLIAGAGVCGCIHNAAGDELQDECDTLDGCPEGSSKMTKGYKLPAKHVIHTVGPKGEKPTILSSAYNSALALMLENDLRSIAFPCISTGIYGYPQDEAAHVACLTVRDFLEEHKDKVDRVIFATFLKSDLEIYEELMQKYFPVSE